MDKIVKRDVELTTYRFGLSTLHARIRLMNVCSTSHVLFSGVKTYCGCIFTARQRVLASSFSRFLDHIQRHASLQDSSGRVINPSQRPLPDSRQPSQQTNIHALCGIRTHNLSRRAAEDLHLRPRGHWDLRSTSHTFWK